MKAAAAPRSSVMTPPAGHRALLAGARPRPTLGGGRCPAAGASAVRFLIRTTRGAAAAFHGSNSIGRSGRLGATTGSSSPANAVLFTASRMEGGRFSDWVGSPQSPAVGAETARGSRRAGVRVDSRALGPTPRMA